MIRLILAGVLWALSALVWAQAPAPQEPLRSITVVLDDNYPPYISRDSKGELQGILKDYWALWQQRTGIGVNLQAMDWALAQRRMQAHQADVIDTMFQTPERQQTLDFTPPYARIDVAIFFHRSISGIVDTSSLRGFTVGVKDGDACIDTLGTTPDVQLKRYPSYTGVIDAAQSGEIRVFCMDEPPAVYLLNQRGLADSYRQSAPIASGEFHRAVHKGNTHLMAALAQGFALISPDEIRVIEEKWLGTRVKTTRQSPYVRYLGYGALAASALTLMMFLWNLSLRRKVQQKTRSLTESLEALSQTRQVLEHALVEQKAMLDNDMVGIVKVRNRVVMWANRAFENIFGFGPGELAGTPTSMYYTSMASYFKLAAEAYPVMAAGEVYRTEAEFVRRDGQRIWVELSGAMLNAAQGDSLWIFADVSEHRSLNVGREEALTRLRKMADRVPGVLYQYLLRPDGTSCFPFASEWIRRIYQISPQEAAVDASGAFAAIHPDDAQAVLESIQESARALTPWQHEYRARFADGSVHWLYGNSLPERLDDGSVLWHGFITDITERKAADERLRQLSRSVEQAPLSIVITDLQGDILYVNPSFTRHTGYTLDEVLGHNPRILKSGQTPQQTYLCLWDTLCSGAVWEGELYNRRKNGEMFIEHAVIAPVLDAQGKTSHYVAVKEDITERKGAEQALQASLHEKVALLNEVHHRVKNNLQVISSLLRLEASRCTEPATKDVLKEMQGRILTMALLHETLYRVGRFASVDLGAYLKQLATQTFRAQSSQSTTVRLSLDVAEVQVVMDQATPCGLLVNELLSNCLKHAFPDGRTGEVQVRSQPDVQAGSWMVQVRDNGIGLPPDFELRGRQSLGLQLVSDLARQLDGSLQVASSGGASFTVVFPLVQIKAITE
ncbi:MAG: PAS domain S-box protein [Rhodoferax sp.]|jgi:two-component system cell cycle sensor histidine kinase/response regulator CckA|uniref:PAS domain S-box protein n=1 Tax=Rhodoferax sp. TaxID=50421 RepID=UPI001B40D6DF|nr:PAS domain S-box protein [Rhodoferax sp.]MBP9148267.1 PAS domain S-box protein [Rhodoferax sp.]MBP9736091.1 PAS domain S-box protein [Rhodoferax sp.]